MNFLFVSHGARTQSWKVLVNQLPSSRPSSCQRKTLLSPLANATIHGGDIRVSHSLQGVSRQRGAESATAVQNQGGAQVRYTLLHVPFKDSLAEMHGRR